MKKYGFLFLFAAYASCLIVAQTPNRQNPNGQTLRFTPSQKVTFVDFSQGDSPVKFALSPGDDLTLVRTGVDRLGNRHYRMQQMHEGIPVFGNAAVLHEKNGVLSTGRGKIHQNIAATATPAISEKSALTYALAFFPAEKYAWEIPAFERELKTATADPAATFVPAGKLVFLPENLTAPKSGEVRLAWQFDLFAVEPALVRSLVFVDAHDGKILNAIQLLHTEHTPASGIARYNPDTVDINTESFAGPTGDTLYRLNDLVRNIHVRDALNLQSNPDADVVHNSAFWGLPAHRTPVAAHWGMEKWYDYMLTTFQWQGFANDSTPMLGWVHFDHNFNNAFWNGNWVNFGDGDGTTFNPLVQLDIVGHECSHALVQNTCGLLYLGEAGALNEGLCDIFATLLEEYAFPDSWNWKLGEAAYFDHYNGLRRLDFPNAAGDPDTYDGQFWVNTDGCIPGISNDQCGIHSNCGVLGKFFYILAQGETGTNELGTSYSIAGIGLKKAADILFQSLDYLLPTDGFAEMRHATLEAAVDLFPGTENAVAEAWCAVGVEGCDLAITESILMTSPDTFTTYQHGGFIPIHWDASQGVKNVDIYLSVNDGASWQLLKSNLPASSGQSDLPAPPVFSSICRLRVADAENPFVSDRSDTTFAITGCGLKAHFTASVATVCFGQPFFAANDSPDKTADFQWRWNGSDYNAPDSLLEIPAMTIPGENRIELVAADSAGCRDTFGLTINVLPQLTAEFSVETHGTTLVASAHFQSADTYIWLLGGQQVGSNSPALTLPGLAPGVDSLRLVVVLNVCPGGVAEAVAGVVVDAAPTCVGNDLEVRQITYTNDIIDIAERGDKLYLAMPGCAAELDKNTHAFKIFKPENTGGVLSLPLTCVTVRQDGRVLFGTDNCGIAVYNPADSTWEQIQNSTWLPSNQVEKMETSTDGDTWILTKFEDSRQLIKWTSDSQPIYFPTFYNIVNSMAPVGDDLWFCGNSGPNYLKKATFINGLGVIEEITEPPVFQNTYFRCMASNGQKVWLWMSSAYSFIEFDLPSHITTVYDSTNSSLPATNISFYQIEDDHAGGAWLMGGNKPYHYDGAGNFIKADDPAFNTANQNVIFTDSNDHLWMGTRTGLRKYANNTGSVIDFATNGFKATGVAVTEINDIESVPGGNRIAVSQYAKFFETTNGIAQPIAPGCLATAAYLDIDSSGNIWSVSNNKIAKVTFEGNCTQLTSLPTVPVLPNLSDVKTWGKYMVFKAAGQLLVYDQTAGTTQNIIIPAGYWYFAEGNSSSLWAKTTKDTLLEIRPDFSVHQYPTLPPTYYGTNAFAVNKDGDLWFGRSVVSCCPNYSYSIFHRDTSGVITPVEKLNNDFNIFITCLETDNAGNLWVGYQDKGLVKYSPVTNTYELFTTCDGLPSNTVTGVAFSADGHISVATWNGVGIFTPSSDTILTDFVNLPVCLSRPTTFQNTTLGATSYEWKLDGQTIDSTKNLTHTFDQTGQHILTLVARNAQGCETAVSKVIEVNPEADLSDIPSIWANCDNSTQIEAPPGMAAYQWRNGTGTVVGSAQKLPVTQSGLYSLKITDHCGSTAQKQITVLLADCVWPGDVNADGIVDYRDWVAMSLVFGYAGPARDEQGITFKGHPALPWSGQLPNGANIKHADGDGNGMIDLLDFEAIEVNYGKTHGAYPGLDGPKPSPLQFAPVVLNYSSDTAGVHYITVGILAVDTSGSLNTFSAAGLVCGWTKPAPIKLMEMQSVDFSADNFGIQDIDMKSFSRQIPGADELHLACTALDHQNRQNVSLLAKVDYIIIEDNIGIGDSLDLVFSVSGAQALTNDGKFLPVGAGQGKFTLTGSTVKTTENQGLEDFDLLVFPNPSSGIFTAVIPAANTGKTVFTVCNVNGQVIWRQEKTGPGAEIDLSPFPAGAYFLQVISAKRQAIRRLVKM